MKFLLSLFIVLATFGSAVSQTDSLSTNKAVIDSLFTDSIAEIAVDSGMVIISIPDSITSDSSLIEKIEPGTVTSIHSPELDTLVQFQKSLNTSNCPNVVKGFRVQIYSCSGSDCQSKAEKTYNQFLIAYPSIQAYKIWDAPSHKVRVGNCRNRFQAEAIKALIKEDFPFIFIVPDFIDSPYKVDCVTAE